MSLAPFLEIANRPLPRGLAGLPAGIGAPWLGLRLMRAEPRLWRGTLVAVAVQSVVTLALFALWGYAAWHWLWPAASADAAWWAQGLRYGLAVLAFALGLFVVSALGTVIGMALTPFAYGALAEKVELVLGGDPRAMRPLSTWRQGVESVRAVVELLVVNAVLLGLGWVPPLSPFCAVAGFLFNAWFLGLSCLEYAQVLRGIERRDRRQRSRRFRGATLGLGSGAVLWSTIPILGSFLTAAAVAGGGILIHRMEKGEAV